MRLLSVEQALARVLEHVPAVRTEPVELSAAHGRVLAGALTSPRDVPPWDNSAMDGYAVRAADTRDGEVDLELNEVIAAGSVGTREVRPGTASAIMTGAPVPVGADAVVMVEHTDGAREGRVRVQGRARPGQHIRLRGDDVRIDDVVLEAGHVLDAAAVGMAASLGLARIPVARRPVVAILSTGDEIIAPGRPLGPGQIYSSNNVTLAGLLRDAGAVPRDLGIAPDDREGLVANLRRGLDADAILTTGGVSVGAFDFVKEAMGDLGVEMDFWKVRMKPGKPLAFGRVAGDGGGVAVFGLPGNPVSCMVNFLQFVRPWIRLAMGDPRPYLPVVAAVAAHDFHDRVGRARLIRVTLEPDELGWRCRSTGSQSSAVLTSMVRAHGLLLVGPEDPAPSAGEAVKVQLLQTDFLAGSGPGYPWADRG